MPARNTPEVADVTTANALQGGQMLTDMIANANTLRHDEWAEWDLALVDVARERLNAVMDLKTMGQTVNLRGLGTTLSFYERSSDMLKADVSLDGMTKANADKLTFDEVGVPVPIHHKDFPIGIRQLEASRTRGEPLSTTQVRVATRLVADSLESALMNGIPGFNVSGHSSYGYTTHPDRNTVTLSGTGWATESGRNITGDIEKMLAASYADNYYGPYYLYVAQNIWAAIQGDYSAEKAGTFKQRIEAYSEIMDVKSGDYLPDGEVVLVQMTSDVVDLAIGQDIVAIEYNYNPMQTEFKVVFRDGGPRQVRPQRKQRDRSWLRLNPRNRGASPPRWSPKLWSPKLWSPKLWSPKLWSPKLWSPKLWSPKLWNPAGAKSAIGCWENIGRLPANC